MTNRLTDETSPYLLQHAGNPVEWWPWGQQALAEASRLDRPVLLSIGYAACHWCHVMAHESFEDEAVAAYLNAHFVCIKVDREERPDVDAVYMEATQAMTGHGGWPMTVFMTPAGEPFYCGTYYPPAPRQGMPSFTQILAAVTETWTARRAEVLAASADITRRLAGSRLPSSVGDPPTADQLDAAVRLTVADRDARHGGFGTAPKFPPSMVLEMLLRHHARTGDASALATVEQTCEAMARGGMYDQLAGGFARYSVDAGWVVPHFEKMLYDNALLARVYVHLWRATGSPLARRVAEETADFMVRELGTAQCGLASALDADSEGEEGRFYVWTPAQLDEVLGQDDGPWAADLLNVTAAGTFEHGSSVLQLRTDPADPQRWDDVRGRLLAARSGRVRPARDDKVVAAWNGLAIATLAEVGSLLDRPDLVDAAAAAADLLVSLHLGAAEGAEPARLARVSRDGRVGRHAGVLEDYADVAEGFLALFSATGDERWVQRTGVLLETVLAHFRDGAGGFYDTADDAEALVRRPQDPTDGATPSGWAAAAGALLGYAAYTGSSAHREVAVAALGLYAGLAERAPRYAGWGLSVAQALLDGPREVAVLGPPDDESTRALLRTARLGTAPGAVVAPGDPRAGSRLGLLEGRGLVGGRPAAYVCRHFVCDRPVTSVPELESLVAARPG